MKPKCKNCRRLPVNRPRGLCWGCWHKPEVLARFPITSKFCPQVPTLGNSQKLPADQPTTSRPGTLTKVAVLEFRASRGLALWHPGDASLPPD
jgi:hypothetical protein